MAHYLIFLVSSLHVVIIRLNMGISTCTIIYIFLSYSSTILWAIKYRWLDNNLIILSFQTHGHPPVALDVPILHYSQPALFLWSVTVSSRISALSEWIWEILNSKKFHTGISLLFISIGPPLRLASGGTKVLKLVLEFSQEPQVIFFFLIRQEPQVTYLTFYVRFFGFIYYDYIICKQHTSSWMFLINSSTITKARGL